MGTRHTQFFMDKEYPNTAGSGGGGTEVIPNPTGTATDTLSTIEIDGTIYDFAGGGEPTKTLVYQLTRGGAWETFSNPHSSKKLLVEAEGYGIVRSGEFEPTLLPAREGGDNYVTIANTPVGNLPINLGQTGSGETIYISTNGGYDTNIQTVRVYKLD